MDRMEVNPEMKEIDSLELKAEEYKGSDIMGSDEARVIDDSEGHYNIDSPDADTANQDDLIVEDEVFTETSNSEPALQEEHDEPEGELSPYPFALSADCVTTETWEFAIEVGNATESVLESTVAPHGGPDRDSDEFNPDVVYNLIVEPGEFGSITVTDLPEAAWYEWTTGDTMLADFHGSMIDFSLCATTTDEEHEQPTEQAEPEEAINEPSEETTETTEETAEPVTLPDTGASIELAVMLGIAAVGVGTGILWRQKSYRISPKSVNNS